MKKIQISFLALSLLFSVNGMAQLSDRENNASKLKIGARPVNGDMGFSVIASNDEIRDWLGGAADTTTERFMMPTFVYRYYLSDDMVFRFGMKSNKENSRREGTIDPNVNGIGGLTAKTDIDNMSEFFFIPAIEKHFLNSNIFDAYIVGSIPLGYLTEKEVTDRTYEFGDFTKHTMTKKSVGYGLGLHFGLQAFIADLPLAVGVEIGGTGIGFRGEKFKHEVSNSVGGVVTNQVYYTFKDDPANVKYSDLKSNSFEADGNFRVSISYFFRK